MREISERFDLEDLTAFEDGELPRRLWRITMRRR